MLLFLIGLFLLLLFLGVPIVAAMGIPAAIYFIITEIPLSVLTGTMFKSINSFTMVAVPLFILMGYLINTFRETDRVYTFARTILRNARGYSAKVNVVMSLILSGMSGAALADIAGLGRIQIRAMENEGFTRGYGAGVTLATSIIGPIFPPSIPLIIYALIAEVSGIQILLAGIIPGILIATCLYTYVSVVTNYKLKNVAVKSYEPIKKGETWDSFQKAFPMLIAAPIVIFGMLFGIFSPAEAGAMGVLYLLILGILHKEFTWKGLVDSLKGTFIATSTILLIVTSGSIFTTALTLERLPELISSTLLNFTSTKVVIILIIILMLLIVGMFMDAIPALIMMTPIFLTVATQVGIDPIHLGIIMVFTLMIGTATPPVGMGLYTAASVANVSPSTVAKELVPLYIPILAALLIVAFIPSLTLWVVNLF
ncbi:TRAP transporter large permease [Lentibacillus salinarum]|uniref:TRAP transporter large permease n=1 Tax=Lentibacillus salinarum TaxID=446820 RepID=A0ABW3ZUZ3_9BACI